MTAFLVNIDDPFFAEVAKRLQARSGSVAAIATQKTDWFRAMTPAIEIVDTKRLYRHADVAQLLADGQPGFALSDDLLRDLLECEHYFLTMTDRTQSRPRSVTARRRLFRDLVRFWGDFLERRPSIETVWFESTPHMGWDLVLFYVARRLGRRTSVLARTLLDDRVYLHDDFRHELAISVPGPDADDLEERVGPELLALIGRSSSWIERSFVTNAEALMQESFRKRAKIRAVTTLKMARSLVKPAGFFSATAGDDDISAVGIRASEVAFRRELKRLRRSYDALARPAGGDAPYVYFSMHYQPERTSQPEALMFDDQFVAIELISRALPSGWRPLVKEHPRQLGLYPAVIRRRHARQPLDYRQIADLPNVHLVPVDTPSAVLIKDCRLTATLTGTTGWEGLVAGKPALLFGPAWYSRCPSATVVRSVADAKAAIARAETTSPEAVRRDVLALLAGLRPMLFRSSTSEKFARASKADYGELVDGLVAALADAITGRGAIPLATSARFHA